MITSPLTAGIAIGAALSAAAGTGLVPWSVANGVFTCLAAALGGYLAFKLVERWLDQG
jgi:hypothetical protein